MSIQDRLAMQLSKSLQVARIPEGTMKGKTTLIKKPPPQKKKNHPQQLQTDNVFSYDTENTSCLDKSKIYYLLESCELFTKQKGCHKEIRYRFLKTKHYRKNLVKGMSTWVVSPVRYSEPFLKWSSEVMDQKTRKLVNMHKVLHLKGVIDRLYVSRKERESGLANIEDYVDASI